MVPRCFYPVSLRANVDLLTVPACRPCNATFQDDEPHVRSVLALAGEQPPPAVQELWETKVRRGFQQPDGVRRMLDLVKTFVPVQTAAGPQHLIYPGRDERVLRVVRKVARGLCHYHELMSPVPDSQVIAGLVPQEFPVPPHILAGTTYHHREPAVFEYRFEVVDRDGVHTAWLLTFFGRTTFCATVASHN